MRYAIPCRKSHVKTLKRNGLYFAFAYADVEKSGRNTSVWQFSFRLRSATPHSCHILKSPFAARKLCADIVFYVFLQLQLKNMQNFFRVNLHITVSYTPHIAQIYFILVGSLLSAFSLVIHLGQVLGKIMQSCLLSLVANKQTNKQTKLFLGTLHFLKLKAGKLLGCKNWRNITKVLLLEP